MLPERRKFTVVRFSAKALAPTLTIDPKAVEQQFEARKASYDKAGDALAGRDSAERSRQGAAGRPAPAPRATTRKPSPSRSASTRSATPTSRSRRSPTSKAGAAAFAMQAGQVSGPVQGDFKTVVIKVTKVTPAQPPTSTRRAPRSKRELRQAQASKRPTDLSNKFDDLVRGGGASLADAAAKVGRDGGIGRPRRRRRQGPAGPGQPGAQPEAAPHGLPAQPGRRQRHLGG